MLESHVKNYFVSKGNLKMKKKFFTSESVTEGHPDKLCDQVSDAVLDAIISKDPEAHVACEVCATKGLVHIMGEISTNCYVDIAGEARKVIKNIGYTGDSNTFDADTCGIITSINSQSSDISMGVDCSLEIKDGSKDDLNQIGAGDQGIMFGFACDESPELMPLSISIAHKLAKKLAEVRKNLVLPYLRPDGKTQVTLEYDENGPVRVDTVLVSAQHSEDISQEQMKNDIIEEVILPVIPESVRNDRMKILVNPTGRFVIGGPEADAGLTGRKIIVDTYGGYSRHGGGAFSGKDPTKVDRSAAYAARYIAKNVVAAKIASKCEVQIAYAIGVASPVSIMVDTFSTSKIEDEKISNAIREIFDLRPAAIIEKFGLRAPIYTPLAAYGHMGREDLGVSWEKIDKVDDLRSRLNV